MAYLESPTDPSRLMNGGENDLRAIKSGVVYYKPSKLSLQVRPNPS